MLPPRRDVKVTTAYPKTLAEWLQLDYFHRRGRLRRWRGPLGLATAIGCLALMLGASWWPGGRRAFQPAPVSRAHAMFNDDCRACHTTTFRPAARLVSGDEVRSVTDDACLRCHDGPIHHARQIGTTACASCHREHQRTGSLARMADRHCTACHADLGSHTELAKKSDSDRRFRDVSGFTGQSHPQFDAWKGKSDPGTIRFSHRAHLKPEGVPLAGRQGRRVLECLDCHRPDQGRRYMQPIRYQGDCAGCHPLSIRIEAVFEDPRTRDAAALYQATPAPHPAPGESPGTVRAEVRERLIRFIQENPTALGKSGAGVVERSIPGRDRRGSPPLTGEEWEWVGHQLDRAEHLLFDGAGGCRYCHTETSDPARRPGDLPRYAASALGARWFPHSTFDHDSHRELDCQQCHADTRGSDRSSQILMPKVGTCQQCHAPSDRGARSDCVECHAYHNRREESRPGAGLTIEEALAPSRHDAPHVPRPQP